MDYYDSIYTSDLQNILNDIYNNDGGENLYGESNAVNEDPRTVGTFTIERVTTTYTDNTTDVQYTIIDHIDDVSYLVGAFGEDVDHQNGAILRNFLGVSKTTDHGTNVKAFLNADPNIAKQGETNTLMIAAGIPSTGGSLDARSNAAKFRVYEDGTLYASDANVSGTVNADSGHVGGFDIANNQLVADLDEIDTLQGMPSIKLSITEDDGNKSIELGSYRTTDEMDSPIIATKFEMQHS